MLGRLLLSARTKFNSIMRFKWMFSQLLIRFSKNYHKIKIKIGTIIVHLNRGIRVYLHLTTPKLWPVIGHSFLAQIKYQILFDIYFAKFVKNLHKLAWSKVIRTPVRMIICSIISVLSNSLLKTCPVSKYLSIDEPTLPIPTLVV